ncbi:hypothetical protein BGZ46_003399 [Entomortierella lignicola]|nr:hypothetical protein BGZ46_003399 [Entomortierella lignicola]
MARQGKDYCCCCIPLRFAVGIIAIVALILGAANLWVVLKGTNESTSKTSAYISAGVYAVLGLSGLLSALIKTYSLAKNFSVLWWTITIIVTILSVINLVLIATRDKGDLQTICRANLLNDDKYSSGNYNPDDLNNDVTSCYNAVLIFAGASLAVQVLIMSLCGWVASRYTGEVKHMHDNDNDQVHISFQGQPQPQGQLQPQDQQGYYKA